MPDMQRQHPPPNLPPLTPTSYLVQFHFSVNHSTFNYLCVPSLIAHSISSPPSPVSSCTFVFISFLLSLSFFLSLVIHSFTIHSSISILFYPFQLFHMRSITYLRTYLSIYPYIPQSIYVFIPFSTLSSSSQNTDLRRSSRASATGYKVGLNNFPGTNTPGELYGAKMAL